TPEGERKVEGDQRGADDDEDDRALHQAGRDRRSHLLHHDVRLLRLGVGGDGELVRYRRIDLLNAVYARRQRGDGEVVVSLGYHHGTQIAGHAVDHRGDLRLGRRLGQPHVDAVASAEIDAEVETPDDDREDAGDDDRQRSGEVPVARTHDVEASPGRLSLVFLVDLRV